MKKRVLSLAAVLTIALLFSIVITHPETVFADQTIVSCPDNASPTGWDYIDRGFYISSYPGTNLKTVTVDYKARPGFAGSYTITMTARSGSYSGSILGANTVTVNLSDSSFTQVTFDFGGVSVPNGSIVTFTQSLVSGPPSGDVGYNYGTCGLGDQTCNSCPGVIETDDTVAPLSTFRRGSVGVTIAQSTVSAVPTMTEWGMIIFMVLAGLGAVYYMRRQRRIER
jgi:hypothetical protein